MLDRAEGLANLPITLRRHDTLNDVLQEPLQAFFLTCPGRPGCLSALSVSHTKSVFYGAFVGARGVLSSQKTAVPGSGQ
jgi:hypothetical protein